MLKLTVIILAITMAHVLATTIPIKPVINHTLRVKGTADIIVSMKQKTFPVLKQISAQSLKSRSDRINLVAGSLKALAAESQKYVLIYLATKENIQVKSLWASNKIIIKGATAEIIQRLAGMKEVGSIIEDGHIPWNHPADRTAVRATQEIQWGIERVEAPVAWEQGYRGSGVVVGTIDTGARHTHTNLNNNWRSVRGWFDPYYTSPTPSDNSGHGTHVAGTIAGIEGIGVAPDAQWIACRGCDGFGCEFSTLEECGQFMLCPTLYDGTEEDCSAAPHIVNNSWGAESGDDFFDEIVAAWSAAGIIPVFANGNSGPMCATPLSPADSYKTPVVAVGATDIKEELYILSSAGPNAFNASIIKPDIAAPGVEIVSASGEGDDQLEAWSGTSMACPHVAGAIALLLSNGTELTFEAISTLLYAGATHTVAETGENCGGIPENQYPNNHVGWGRLSVRTSIEGLQKLRSQK